MENVELEFIEKNFRLNWCGKREKVKPILTKPLRTTISAPRFVSIVGEKTAQYIFRQMVKMKEDKKRYRVRDKGILNVYCK